MEKVRNRLSQLNNIPDLIPAGIYLESNIYPSRMSKVLLNHYYFYNDKLGFGIMMELYPMLSKEQKNILLEDLGLINFQGTRIELLSLLNLIPGLNWNADLAKEITSIPLSDIEKISDLPYINIVLGYVTGYKIKYDVYEGILLKKSDNYIISAYASFHTENIYKLSDMRTPHIITDVSEEYINIVDKYLESYDSIPITEVIEKYKMVPPEIKYSEYFIQSLYDYNRVDTELKPDIIEGVLNHNNIKRNLETFSDETIINDILEFLPQYRYREGLITETLSLMNLYFWSLHRRKYCIKRNKSETSLLTYGIVGRYYCFDYESISNLWSKEIFEIERSFERPDYERGEAHRFLSPNDVSSLIGFLQESKLKKFNNILESLRDGTGVNESRFKDKDRILVFCLNEHKVKITEEVLEILNKNDINVERYIIEYISNKVSYIKDEYVVLDYHNFDSDTIRSYIEGYLNFHSYYDLIIYDDNCEKRSVLSDPDMINIVSNLLTIHGVFLTKIKNLKQVSLVKEEGAYSFYTKLSSYGKSLIIEYIKPAKIGVFEQFFGENWQKDWQIVRNSGGGDCLYYVIGQGLEQWGLKIPVSKFREDVAKGINESNLEKWRESYIADILSNVPRNQKIEQSKQLSRRKITVEEIRNYVRKGKWATLDEVKILSEIYGFIPIIILGDQNINPLESLCEAVPHPERLLGSKIDKIMLIKLASSHYELIERREDRKRIFSADELPNSLIEAFRTSCFLIREKEKQLGITL